MQSVCYSAVLVLLVASSANAIHVPVIYTPATLDIVCRFVRDFDGRYGNDNANKCTHLFFRLKCVCATICNARIQKLHLCMDFLPICMYRMYIFMYTVIVYTLLTHTQSTHIYIHKDIDIFICVFAHTRLYACVTCVNVSMHMCRIVIRVHTLCLNPPAPVALSFAVCADGRRKAF